MIAGDGSVRVMDFGLARLAAVEAAGGHAAPAAVAAPADGDAPEAPIAVTQAGTIVGTPAYMAPEQFRGEPADARSDQFSFCIALYEALYGARPFSGQNLMSLTLSVTEGDLQPAPPGKTHDVPVRIRRALTRGLRRARDKRFPSMEALIEALEDDAAVRRRRRLGAAAVGVAIAAALVLTWQTAARRRAATEREIAAHLDAAGRATAEARTAAATARTLRTDALAAFDRADRRAGEQAWRQVRTQLARADAGYDRGARNLEAVFTLDPSRAQHRDALADLCREHMLLAEDFRLGNKADVLAERLAAVDPDGSKRRSLAAPGTLELHVRPVAARVRLERYERDPATGRRRAKPVDPFDPFAPTLTLPAGSYRLLFDGPGRAPVIYPFEITRGARTRVDVALPPAAAVPSGFVYVPAGTFWFGDADEQFRTQFLNAVPLHRREIGAYLIARNEATFDDWIAFLDDLPPAQRARRAPASAGTFRGALYLRRGPAGWQLEIQPASRRYRATQREPIAYVGRNQRSRQDWTRFPIGGISLDEVTHYLTWLRETGRLPGARLCTELEWERAARGADDRLFPHGDELAPDDANIDVTYDRIDGAYGPDEVGSHPDSRSPFDVEDLAGNIMEMVASETPGGLVIRGGGYYFSAASARSSNREQIPRATRDVAIGVRICADAPKVD
jgi:formylglycine-generating enzyme required for sulfatase activity